MARTNDTETQEKKKQEELRAKIRRIENGGNILKILSKALIATKMPQGATAVKENLDKEDAETKELTDKSMDILDRVAVPKIIERRRMLAKEKQFATVLKTTYEVSDEAIKAVAAGGFGQLEGFVKYIEEINKVRKDQPKLTGDQINTLVKNADAYKDNKLTAMQFLDSKFKLTKELLEENPSHPNAALFGGIVGTPRQRAKGQLSQITVLDDINAFDLVRMSKAGELERTDSVIGDTPYERNLKQEERFTSASQLTRHSSALGMQFWSDYTGLAGSNATEKYGQENKTFQLMLLQKGIKITGKQANGAPIYDSPLYPDTPTGKAEQDRVVENVINNYDLLSEGVANPNIGRAKQYELAQNDARKVLQDYVANSIEDIEYVINLLDPDESGTVFKDFDEFKIKDPTTGTISKISYAEVMERLRNI